MFRYRPGEIPYGGGPPPRGYRFEMRKRSGLMLAGAITFGASYLASVVVAWRVATEVQDASPAFNWLYVPLAGPWLSAAALDDGDIDDVGAGLFWALAALDGLAQALGALLAAIGVLTPERRWIRDDLPVARLRPAMLAPHAAGLHLWGRF